MIQQTEQPFSTSRQNYAESAALMIVADVAAGVRTSGSFRGHVVDFRCNKRILAVYYMHHPHVSPRKKHSEVYCSNTGQYGPAACNLCNSLPSVRTAAQVNEVCRLQENSAKQIRKRSHRRIQNVNRSSFLPPGIRNAIACIPVWGRMGEKGF